MILASAPQLEEFGKKKNPWLQQCFFKKVVVSSQSGYHP